MSWLFKSLQATDDDIISAESPSECVRFTTADPSVKDDFSSLGESLSRQFRGFANFLAPPPTTAVVSADDYSDSSSNSVFPSQTLQGIRNDLAEIGGGLRNGFSMLSVNSNKAVGGISRFASNLLPFRRRSADNEEDDGLEEEVIDDTPGITHEVLNFVNNISSRSEYWTEFPLALDETDFEMSDVQRMHVATVEQLVPSVSALKLKLQNFMCNEVFWMIYFILLLPRFDQSDFELLATSEIVEARNILVDKLQRKEKPHVNSEDTCDNNLVCGIQKEENMQSHEKQTCTQIIEGGKEFETGGGDGDGEKKTNQRLEKGYSKTCTDDTKRARLEGVSFNGTEDDGNDFDLCGRSSSTESNDWVQLHENLTWKQGKDSESGDSSGWFDVDEFD